MNGGDVTSVKEKETIEGESLSTSGLTLVLFFFFNGGDVTSVKEKETIEGEGLSTSGLTLVLFFFFSV